MKNTPTAAFVRVIRPELTPEERERRLGEIKKAASGLIVATMRKKWRSTV